MNKLKTHPPLEVDKISSSDHKSSNSWHTFLKQYNKLMMYDKDNVLDLISGKMILIDQIMSS